MFRRFLFIKNAVLLTVTSIVLRSAGMLFRVYLSGEIGSEGMGLYQLIFSVHILASTLATSGLSVAVTRLVSDRRAVRPNLSVRPIMRKAMGYSMAVSITIALLLYLGAGWVARVWLSDVRALASVRIIGFALPFMSLSACMQGYFVARRKISSTSASQLFEQTIRMGLTFCLLEWGLAQGVAFSCFAVVVGNVVSELASCLYLYGCYRKDMKETGGTKEKRTPGLMVKLLSIALPIGATNGLNSGLRTVENLILPLCLTLFCSRRELALSQIGMLKGMAMPVLFFPSAFLGALSMLLLPEISEAHSLGHRHRLSRTVGTTLHITLASAIFIGSCFLLFADELGALLYSSQEVGAYIRFFAPLMPLMYLESVVDGILKGLNQQMSTFYYSMLDSLLRIGLIFWIVPRQGMLGFLLIMAFSNVLTSTLNIRRLLNVMDMNIQWGKWVVKPVLCAAAACGAVKLAFGGASSLLLYLIAGVAAAGGLFVALMLLTGGLNLREFLPARGR